MPRSLLLASTVSLGLLSGFIFVLVILLSIFIGDMGGGLIGAIITTIIINVILWLVSPWFSDWMYRFFYKNQWTTLEELAIESPKTAEIIRKICEAEMIKLPKIGIIPDDNPNAFTYGSGPWNARIIITHGIIRFLSDEERSSVVAHELGHIANRDFIIMTIASTLLQILYEIYYYTNKQKRGDSDKKSKLAMIGLVAYIFYWAGSYILLYLSRVREYAADAFSAKYTDANLLADALIKIAMGILSTPGDARLVKSTRYIGVAGDAVSKQLGLVYKNCEKSGSFELLGRSLLFDLKSPWAFLAELSSTHPLSGKRIGALMKQTLAPKYDLTSIEQRLQIDTNRLYRGFARDLTFVIIARLAPWILGLITLIALLALHIPIEGGFLFVATGFLVGIVVSMLIKLWMMYPANQDEPTTILEAMGDIYASPVRGRKISLEGQLVGRGIPGYIFSEDMLMQDKTGLIYVDYESRFGWIGNLFYSLKKAAENIGKDVRTSGWFFRDMSSRIVADRITGEGIDLKGGVRLWMLIGIVLMTVVSGVVGVIAKSTYEYLPIKQQGEMLQILSKSISSSQSDLQVPQDRCGITTHTSYSDPTEEGLLAHPNWKFRDQYDVVHEFSHGLAKVVDGYDEGVINLQGEIVVSLGKYRNIENTFEGGIIVASDTNTNICSMINSSGTTIHSFNNCSSIHAFHDGYAVLGTYNNNEEGIKKLTKPLYSIINQEGEIVNQIPYRYISDFHEGMAEVVINAVDTLMNSKIGYINTTNQIQIPDIYDFDSNSFQNGLAVVQKDGAFGVINKQNETIIPFEYSEITTFNNGFAFAQKENSCGILNMEGNFKLIRGNCKLYEGENNLAIIKEGNSDYQEIINQNGETILKKPHDKKVKYVTYDFNDEHIKQSEVGEDFQILQTIIFDIKGNILFSNQGHLDKTAGVYEPVFGEMPSCYIYPDGYVKWIK